MGEGEGCGVQQMVRAERAVEGAVRSVGGVADDRVADGGELAADLVRHAGGDRHLEQRAPSIDAQGLVESLGEQGALALRQRGGGHAAHAASERRAVREPARDAAGLRHLAVDHGEVRLVDRARRELAADGFERGLRPRAEHDAGGAGIDAVEESRHGGIVAHARHLGEARGEGVGQRAGFAGLDRVARLAAGLVDGEDGVVGEEDAQFSRLGQRRAVGALQQPRQGHDSAATRAIGLGGRPVVEQDAAFGEGRVDQGAGRSGEAPEDRLVEPSRPFIRFVDRECDVLDHMRFSATAAGRRRRGAGCGRSAGRCPRSG